MPDDVYQVLADALKEMYDDPRFHEFAQANGLTLDDIPGPEFALRLKAESEIVIGTLKSQGHIQ